MTYTDEIIERERRFLLPTYNRYPIALERGKGVFVYDHEGKRYLDFVAGLGVNALGYAHPRVVKAIREQGGRAIHFSNLYYNEFQGCLAEKLCQLSGLHRAFFSNSGTEAIEGSIKLPAGRTPGGRRSQEPTGRAARLVSRTNFRRYVAHRPGQISQGV
jgi:acetylornithine/N-succinyldiaminopimelate aminotransferase